MMRAIAAGLFVLALSIAAPQAQAAFMATISLTGSPTDLGKNLTKYFGSVAVGASVDGAVETFTVVVEHSEPGAGAQIDAITASGDFEVTGGTCLNYATPRPAGDTCTLNLRFKPTAAGIRNGLLSVTCHPVVVGAPGGTIGLVCDNSAHNAFNLNGWGLLAQAVPALGREGLTALAVLLLGSSLFALRRRRS